MWRHLNPDVYKPGMSISPFGLGANIEGFSILVEIALIKEQL
jgi:hypothetical protein